MDGVGGAMGAAAAEQVAAINQPKLPAFNMYRLLSFLYDTSQETAAYAAEPNR